MYIKLTIKLIVGLFALWQMAQSICEVKDHLPQLHQTKITIHSMHQDHSNQPQSFHNYIYNFPLNFLKTHQISSIIFIHSMQWSENINPYQLHFKLKKFTSPTAMLISLASTGLRWENFDIGIILNDYQYRPDLFFGQAEIINHQNPTTVIYYQTQIPSNHGYTNFISYFTGIQGFTSSQAKPEFELDLSQEIISNQRLRFTINVGTATNLNLVTLSYVGYKEDPKTLKKDGQFFFYNFKYQSYEGLRSDLPVTEHYLFGMSSLKFKSSSFRFMVNFQIVSQYVFQVTVHDQFDILKVKYFGISAQADLICNNCPGRPLIYSEGWNNYCIFQCDEDSWIKHYPTQGIACIKCPNLLNMTLPSHKKGCDCAPGFFISGSKCVSFMDIGSYTISNPRVIDNCGIPNMVRNPSTQVCECRPGYALNNDRKCISICGNGFWNGINCQYCPSGTYMWHDIRQCKPCTDNCEKCQNFNACSKCKAGFYRNSHGICAEICGDGIRFELDCDDGNHKNHDGCSSFCQVEEGFACSGGTFRTKDYCWRINFSVEKISQQLTGTSILLDYKLAPTPQTSYSEQQLKKMISIAIEEWKNYPEQILLSHNQNDYTKIRIALHYVNLPNENFQIQLRFVFPDGKVITQTVKTDFQTRYSVFNSRFDENLLV